MSNKTFYCFGAFMAVYATSSSSSFAHCCYKDRIAEFNSIVETLKAIDNNEKQPFISPARNNPSFSNFNTRASKISLGIHDASKKVTRLAKLAKRSSMFDDPTKEIQDIIALLKQEMNNLNSSLVELEALQSFQAQEMSLSNHSMEHSKAVLVNLKERLLQTTNDFKEVLTARTESLKLHENRKQLFTVLASSEKGNPFAQNATMLNLGLSKISDVSSRNTSPPWAIAKMGQPPYLRRRGGVGVQSQIVQEQAFVHDHQHERANALRHVESTVAELAGTFTQLATMVSQQSELAIRIDDKLDDALANVEGAQGALLKYMHSISSNRWLLLKIFLVLIIFLLIFILFVA